jgi:hypothetical protein
MGVGYETEFREIEVHVKSKNQQSSQSANSGEKGKLPSWRVRDHDASWHLSPSIDPLEIGWMVVAVVFYSLCSAPVNS